MEKDTLDPDVVMWRIAIHITFVVSGLLFAIMDYIADKRIFFEIDAERKILEVMQLKSEIGRIDPGAVKAAEEVIEEKI
jgi:uncharacterized membrane protein YqhA